MRSLVLNSCKFVLDAFSAADLVVLQDPATKKPYPVEYSTIFNSKLLSGGLLPTEFGKIIPDQFLNFVREQVVIVTKK